MMQLQFVKREEGGCMPEHCKPLLEAKLKPVSNRDAVAAPIVQVPVM